MTNPIFSTAFARKHITSAVGVTINDRDTGANVCRVHYGMLRDVLADRACNYSYREFWF